MRKYLPVKIFLFILAAILPLSKSIAQCVSYPANATSATPVSCRFGSDGTITVSVIPGASGFHSFLLQRYEIAQNKYVDVQGPIPTAATTYTFTGLTSSRRYRVVTFDADEIECDAPAITTFIDVTQPAELKISLVSKTNIENCFGDETGSLTVAATGGNSGYEYTINGTDYFASGVFKDLPAGDYMVGVKDDKQCTAQIPVTIAQPTQLRISLVSATDPTCAGGATGSIAVTATGGTPGTLGYQYSINGSTPSSSATFSRPAGTYTIEVTDAKGCKATLPTITLTDPAVLNAAINTKTNVSCNGGTDGSATVEVTGGTAPYTFNWSTSPAQQTATATSLEAGTYTVTVADANGCTRTATVTIAQPASVPAPTASGAAVCENEAIPVLTATGTDISWYNATGKIATGSSFNPGVDNMVAGTHTFYATQTVDGCESPKTTVILTIKAVPAAPVVDNQTTICAGQGMPTFRASGANITWYDGTAAILASGPSFTPGEDYTGVGTHTFYVTQTSDGCESNSTAVTLTINPSPAKPTITGTLSFCQKSSTVLTSSAATENEWLLNDNLIPSATGQTLTVSVPGRYAVRVTNADNCVTTSDPVTVSEIATPAAPAVTDVVYCQNATPAALDAVGSALQWYSSATSNDGSPTPPVVSTSNAGVFEYFVSQTVNGCQSPRAKLIVTVHPNPATPTIAGNNTFCADGSTLLTSSAASGNQWYKGPERISGATGQTLTVTQAGSYWVEVRNANGCSAASTALEVTQTTLTAPTISGNLSFCTGGSTVLTSSAATGNQWYKGTDLIKDATGQTLTVTDREIIP
jgi:hypothetical protein